MSYNLHVLKKIRRGPDLAHGPHFAHPCPTHIPNRGAAKRRVRGDLNIDFGAFC
jgi:hypothetical protein